MGKNDLHARIAVGMSASTALSARRRADHAKGEVAKGNAPLSMNIMGKGGKTKCGFFLMDGVKTYSYGSGMNSSDEANINLLVTADNSDLTNTLFCDNKRATDSIAKTGTMTMFNFETDTLEVNIDPKDFFSDIVGRFPMGKDEGRDDIKGMVVPKDIDFDDLLTEDGVRPHVNLFIYIGKEAGNNLGDRKVKVKIKCVDGVMLIVHTQDAFFDLEIEAESLSINHMETSRSTTKYGHKRWSSDDANLSVKHTGGKYTLVDNKLLKDGVALHVDTKDFYIQDKSTSFGIAKGKTARVTGSCERYRGGLLYGELVSKASVVVIDAEDRNEGRLDDGYIFSDDLLKNSPVVFAPMASHAGAEMLEGKDIRSGVSCRATEYSQMNDMDELGKMTARLALNGAVSVGSGVKSPFRMMYTHPLVKLLHIAKVIVGTRYFEEAIKKEPSLKMRFGDIFERVLTNELGVTRSEIGYNENYKTHLHHIDDFTARANNISNTLYGRDAVDVLADVCNLIGVGVNEFTFLRKHMRMGDIMSSISKMSDAGDALATELIDIPMIGRSNVPFHGNPVEGRKLVDMMEFIRIAWEGGSVTKIGITDHDSVNSIKDDEVMAHGRTSAVMESVIDPYMVKYGIGTNIATLIMALRNYYEMTGSFGNSFVVGANRVSIIDSDKATPMDIAFRGMCDILGIKDIKKSTDEAIGKNITESFMKIVAKLK